MIEKIIKISPLIGALLIFCGILKLIFYYSYFDTQIINCLEFQEIVTSFFDDINVIIVFGMIMLSITFFTMNTLSSKTNLPTDDLFDGLMKFLYPRRFKYFFGFLLVFITLGSLIFFDVIGYNYFVLYFLIFCVVQMLTYLLITKDVNGEIDVPNLYGVLILATSLTFSIFLLARKDIRETIANNTDTIIMTSDKTFVCNKKTGNLYLGKTSKYVFFRIKESNSTVVIPSEQIIKYEFK